MIFIAGVIVGISLVMLARTFKGMLQCGEMINE